MKQRIYRLIKGITFASLSAMLYCAQPAVAAPTQSDSQTRVQKNQWQEFHSAGGQCKVRFPKSPDHLSEKMRLPQEGFDLKYDAYISAIDQKTVFMLLIAQYPDFVDESYARMSLEGFLNGILTHNPNNQLIFADLALVDGHEALDFFIRTGGVYFKGRALMVKNSLYLMAMECEVQNYDEGNYNLFVNSFKLFK